MSFPAVLQLLLPTLVPICIGYAVARWVGVPMQPIGALLRTVFLPAILFTALRREMPFHLFMMVVGIGAAMAIVGTFLVRNAHRFLKPKVDPSGGLLNIACFALPFFALSLSSRGLATACALFVGVALGSCLMEVRSVKPLVREPWVYSVIAALVLHALGISTGWLDRVVNPLAASSYILCLLFLGVALHPWASWKNAEAWATVAVRLVSGAAVGLLAVAVLPISGVIAQCVMLTALAPPATQALAMRSDGKETTSGQAATTLGTLASLLVIGTLLVAGWPWRL
jgi:predicted permease